MGNGVLKIGAQAFFNVSSFTEVTLPETLQGVYCFQNTGMKTVNMGAMTSLPEGVFLNCTLETVNFDGTQEQFNAMKAACDSGTQGVLDGAYIVCSDGTIGTMPHPTIQAANVGNTTCWTAAVVNVEYSFDVANLNLFSYTGAGTMRYEISFGGVPAEMNGSTFTFTFTETGTIEGVITAYDGDEDLVGVTRTDLKVIVNAA